MLKALRSIRFRIILPLIVVTLLLTGAVALYNLRLVEAAELAQARRNAIIWPCKPTVGASAWRVQGCLARAASLL